VTISGGDALANTQYVDGDLDGKSITIDSKKDFTFQLGPAETSNDVSRISIADMRASGPSMNLADLSVITLEDAQRALTRLNQAQNQVVEERNRIGAFQNRLQLTLETSAGVLERMQSAEASIRELDVAKAVTALSRSQILSQVATSMAFEADTDVERVLSLLR
jgi:flagellin